MFKDGESKHYIVEYILADDGGMCFRHSPFLLPKGAIFEHEYGTYEVTEITKDKQQITVYCERLKTKTPLFDKLIKK